MLAALVAFLALGVVECNAQYGYDQPAYGAPTSYTVSYGPYTATIPVNDPLSRPDFDSSKCGSNCWGTSGYNHQQRAFDRAQEVYEAQREAFWAE